MQPGIIKNFKVHYRKLLIKHTLARLGDLSEGQNASSICKSVDLLLAIRWIKQAWEEVTPQTIINCFSRCGATPEAQSVDPFADIDADLNEAMDTENMNDMAALGEMLTEMDTQLKSTWILKKISQHVFLLMEQVKQTGRKSCDPLLFPKFSS